MELRCFAIERAYDNNDKPYPFPQESYLFAIVKDGSPVGHGAITYPRGQPGSATINFFIRGGEGPPENHRNKGYATAALPFMMAVTLSEKIRPFEIHTIVSTFDSYDLLYFPSDALIMQRLLLNAGFTVYYQDKESVVLMYHMDSGEDAGPVTAAVSDVQSNLTLTCI